MSFAVNETDIQNPTKIFYEDNGKGKALLFIHGWPLNGDQWEYQVGPLLEAGYRCITYDRRGFGRSDRPMSGYDYITLAADLKTVIDASGATDITLVGFSMGGGEIAKYFSEFGGANVSKVALISTILPFMLKTDDNEEGVPQEVFDGMIEGIKNDRPAFLEGFTKDFSGVSLLKTPVSDAYMQQSINVAMQASGVATIKAANSFATTDFRNDLANINVPTLIIHGTADKIVPIDKSSDRTAAMMPSATYKKYDGEPHGLLYTSRNEVVQDLIAFVG
jgi:pimeloyl-ACP methyl ester carboxylesterase